MCLNCLLPWMGTLPVWNSHILPPGDGPIFGSQHPSWEHEHTHRYASYLHSHLHRYLDKDKNPCGYAYIDDLKSGKDKTKIIIWYIYKMQKYILGNVHIIIITIFVQAQYIYFHIQKWWHVEGECSWMHVPKVAIGTELVFWRFFFIKSFPHA